jgi:tripartite-type tricarboxylate transporter receptor subunit TctC
VRSPQITKILENEGAIGVAGTPADFDKVIRSDIARWAKLLKEMGVQKE